MMLMESPTRASLLVKIRESSNADAWNQFIEIYGPIVFNFAKRLGAQEADAADIVQEVLKEVATSIGRFQYDPAVGKFRSWLFKLAKRVAGRLYNKQKRFPRSTQTQTGAVAMPQPALSELEIEDDFSLEEIWEAEYRKKLFDWAASQIKPNYKAATWSAFWMTAMDGLDANQVATQLGLSVGSVYVAKNRIIKRLAEKIREVDDTQ